jgi:hypothetical protein
MYSVFSLLGPEPVLFSVFIIILQTKLSQTELYERESYTECDRKLLVQVRTYTAG